MVYSGFFRQDELDEVFRLFKCKDKEKCCQVVISTMSLRACYFEGYLRDELFNAQDLTTHALQYRPIWKKYSDSDKRLVLCTLLICKPELLQADAIRSWKFKEAGFGSFVPDSYLKDWNRWG